MSAESVTTRLYPAGILNTLSRNEVERLRGASQGDLAELVAPLGDENANIRWLAGSSLTKIGGLVVVNLLGAYLQSNPGDTARGEALRVLGYLRDKAPMTKSELLRRAHLDKGLRDTLLGRFAAEGLVRVEGKTVTATSYREFVEALYAREELPQPPDLQRALAEMGESPD